MPVSRNVRLISMFVVLSMLVPAVPSPPVAGGSVWTVSGPAFQNGTAANVALAAQGIRLPCDQSRLNNWTRLDPWPSPRTRSNMVYDSNDDVIVLFGGYELQTILNDTWVYDLDTNTWTQMHPKLSPAGRYGHSMAYDSANGVVVLYGGEGVYKLETWTYNLSANTWTNMYPSGNPEYRNGAAMAYDSQNGVTVLYGGSSDQSTDTWIYDYGANTWTEMFPDPAPSALWGMCMVYDAAAGAMVLFGGQVANGTVLDETWLYNYTENTWTRKYPAQSPVAQLAHSMAYEASTGSVVLFGLSYSEAGYGFPATWSYDAGTNTWTNRTPAVMPAWRSSHSMVYSSAADRIILFGGGTNPYLFDDTWTYNTTANKWVRMTQNPGYIYAAGMVFDSRDGVAVHFGGSSPETWAPRNDTFTYDLKNRSWTNRHPPKSPSARIYPGMAYDSRNGVTILFGGHDGIPRDDTWAYNYSQNTWTQLKPYSAPSARIAPTMAYDSDNGVVVLYGNFDGAVGMNDTWFYNYTANTWTEMHPATVPTTRGAYEGLSLAYDTAAKLMVLYISQDIGYGGLNETWTYNVSSNTWTNVTGPVAPPISINPNIAYDEALGLTLLYIGVYGPNQTETWAFNSSTNTWKRLFPGANTGRRCAPLMIYDSANDAVLLVGASYDLVCYDVWAYDLKQYFSPGNWTSQAIDSGGQAYFGAIEWEGSTSANATLMFQLRTADTAGNLNAAPFFGPDGTGGTYYERSGQAINGIHNGSRWMQYRACLCSTNPAETPVLRSVTVGYNLIHDLAILSPAGGENWTGTHNITWQATDPDNDTLSVDIYLVNASMNVTLAAGIQAAAGSWQWDTGTIPSGNYSLRIVARDDNASIPLEVVRVSADFTIFHPIPNHLPNTVLLHPADNATVNTTDVTLEWTGSDDDGDPLNFTVYIADVAFGAGNLPEMYSYKEENTSEVNGLEDGMSYFWTVVAFDGRDNGTVPEIRRFSVDLPPINHPPSISLLFPADNATVNTTNVTLKWNATDEDNDSLHFTLDFAPGPFESVTPMKVPGLMTEYLLSNLSSGTTIYWEVQVTDQKATTCSELRRFSVLLPVPDRPPQITSTPGLNATVNETYFYNVTATDPDNDTLLYELVTFPAAMELNRTTGRIQWKPQQNGTSKVVVRVSDGKGGLDEQTFNVTVKDAPVIRPQSHISTTVSGPVSKRFTIEGTVTAGSRPVVAVQVSIDGGAWADATGTASWSYTVDTTKLRNGMHTIKVRAFDGTSYSEETSFDLEVQNAGAPVEAGFPWWILVIVVLIVVLVAAALVHTRKKKAGAPREEAEPTPPGEPDVTRTEPDEGHAGPETEPLPPGAEEIAIKVEEKPAPATAPAAPPVPASRVAPAGFAVEDMFLMYEDGRLIQHSTRRIKADMDADIMASMLTAVKAFIKESVGMAEGTELGAMEYGDNKILLQKGRYVVLAAVITGAEPADFRDEMKHAVSNIEGEFGPVLASWDGMAAKLAGAKKFLGQLGDYRVREEPVAPAGGKDEVSLKSELEFYQGFVRLKVAIKNGMETYINDASFRLIYKDAVLRLDHIEPRYTVKGDEVVLGNIEPREKKTIAFYLDPQICTESFLEGILSYKDTRGILEMRKLPRKVASVVCPIVYTEENINTAMLRRMAADELDKKDTKVFSIPPALAPEMAFDLAEAAVQHHDLRLVREFTEKDPFVGEAWYYGKAKGRDDKLVVRARVLGEKKALEFFVASGSTLMLTGMLAELKADLNKELVAQKWGPEMRQVTAPDEVDAVAMVRTLLDKAAESDLDAGDTDVGK